LIETRWTVEHNTVQKVDAPLPLSECTDRHVTKTRQTSGGTVAHYHVTKEDGPDVFNPREVDLMYINRMWHAVRLQGIFNVCPVAG
jgi:hypothetical protein